MVNWYTDATDSTYHYTIRSTTATNWVGSVTFEATPEPPEGRIPLELPEDRARRIAVNKKHEISCGVQLLKDGDRLIRIAEDDLDEYKLLYYKR